VHHRQHAYKERQNLENAPENIEAGGKTEYNSDIGTYNFGR
jgi:hypothetical protein